MRGSSMQAAEPAEWIAKATICLIALAAGVVVFDVMADPAGAVRLRFDGLPANDGTIDPFRNLSAYSTALLVLIVAALATVFGPAAVDRYLNATRRHSARLESWGLVLLGALIVFVAWREVQHWALHLTLVAFGDWYTMTALPSGGSYLVGLAAAACVVVAVALRPGWFESPLWYLVALVLVLVASLWGLFQPVSLERILPETLQGIEAHYTGVFGPAESAFAGTADPNIGYSYLGNLIVAICQRTFGTWSFVDYVRAVQVGNFLYLVAALVACLCLAFRRPLVALGTLLLVAPWAHNAHQNLFFPNQSGGRFLSIPLAMCALALAARMRLPSASYVLGIVAGFALAWNFETGVAVTASLVAFLLLRVAAPISLHVFALALRYCVSAGSFIAAVALIELVVFGSTPLTIAFFDSIVQKAAIGEGYGLPFYWDAVAFLFGGIAAWIFLDAAMRRREGSVEERAATRGAIAVLVLVWAAYYAARPHPWDLWSYLLPAGFLFADRLFDALAGWKAGGRRAVVAYGLMAVFIAGPAVIAWDFQLVKGLSHASRMPSETPPDAIALSGVRLKAEEARAIADRAEYAKSVDVDTLANTGSSFLVPKLSGRRDIFPPESLVFSFYDLRGFRQLVSRTLAQSPATLLLDAPDTLAEEGSTNLFMREMEKSVGDAYEPEGEASGWSVWKKR